jgi:hypothetical protein
MNPGFRAADNNVLFNDHKVRIGYLRTTSHRLQKHSLKVLIEFNRIALIEQSI